MDCGRFFAAMLSFATSAVCVFYRFCGPLLALDLPFR